jgi:hypothetical protein
MHPGKGSDRMMAKNNWWESPNLWLVMAAVSTVPFAFVQTPPLTDMPNHISRYFIFLNLDNSSLLQ